LSAGLAKATERKSGSESFLNPLPDFLGSTAP